MGSFMGHILPGSFFLGIGLWWTWTILHRYFVSVLQRPIKGMKAKEGLGYRNTWVAPTFCFGKERPFESYYKIIATSIGMIGEFYTGFDDQYNFVHIGNIQHITMFFFFGLLGVVEVLQYRKFPIPPDSDYITAILACTAEGLIFIYHLHGRKHMDVQVHTLFVYAVILTIISICLEMRFRNNILPAVGRAYSALLQGTWICQIAFVLYPPYRGHEWDLDNHTQMMIITCMFAWHNAAILIFLIIACCVCYARVKKQAGKSYYPLPTSLSSYDVASYDGNELHSQSKQFIVQSEEEEI